MNKDHTNEEYSHRDEKYSHRKKIHDSKFQMKGGIVLIIMNIIIHHPKRLL